MLYDNCHKYIYSDILYRNELIYRWNCVTFYSSICDIYKYMHNTTF